MGTLSLNLVKSALAEADLASAVKAKKVEFNKKSGKVKAPTDPASKLTTIKQVEVNGEMPEPGKGTVVKGNTKSANEVVDEVPYGIKTKAGKKGKDLKPSVAKGPKPKQEPSLKKVSESSSFIPDGSDILKDLPRGSKALGGTKKADKIKKPATPKTIASTTRPTSKEVGKPKEKGASSIKQIKGPKGALPTPSDAGKTPKFDVSKSKNIVESGVQVYVNNQPKSKFGIVGTEALSRLVENYRGFGYEVELRKTGAEWKSDVTLRRLMHECVDAKYNGLDDMSKDIRNEALNHFKTIVNSDYSGLYESRNEFTKVVVEAFNQIERNVEKSYLKNLKIYECQARFEHKDDVYDLEIVTEATDEGMAVRQIANQIAETQGISSEIKHIFVEGIKFTADDIHPWTRKKSVV